LINKRRFQNECFRARLPRNSQQAFKQAFLCDASERLTGKTSQMIVSCKISQISQNHGIKLPKERFARNLRQLTEKTSKKDRFARLPPNFMEQNKTNVSRDASIESFRARLAANSIDNSAKHTIVHTSRTMCIAIPKPSNFFLHLTTASRCGAKHIGKSKCAKQSNLAPILEVPMFKNDPTRSFFFRFFVAWISSRRSVLQLAEH